MKRTISILCSLAIFLYFLPFTVAAQPALETANTLEKSELTEIVALREESVKTFMKEDGGYIAAIYGEAVHYQDENGTWQEIDNTLHSKQLTSSQLSQMGIKGTAAFSTAYLENASSSFKVQLPQVLTKTAPITISHQGYSLGFTFQDLAFETVSVASVSKKQFAVSDQKLSALSARDLDSVATYDKVLPDTQIVYEIRGKKLKESLVFSAPPTKNTFSFRFHYENLYPSLSENGEVLFYKDSNKQTDPVFIIAAPYMYDSGEGYSSNIAVELTPTSDGCVYTITPDANWLNDPERVYPVVLDPTVSTSLTQTEIHDNTVHQSDPNTNYINADRLYVGSVVLSSGTFESRTYIKFPRVTSIPTGAFILNATMTLNHHATSSYQSGSNNTIDVYDCGTNAWETGTITWNTQKNYTFTDRVCYRVSDKSYSAEDFDVTTLVRKWYSTTESNNGLVIKPRVVHTNASNRTAYYSSDISSSLSSKRPHITIEYYTGSSAQNVQDNQIYYIRSAYSGKYLTVPSGVNSSTAYITQSDLVGTTNQQILLKYEGGGIYSLVPQHSSLLRIAVSNGADADGQDLVVQVEKNTPEQYVRIVSNGDGTHRIMPLNSSTRVFDIEGPSIANGARIQIWTWSSSATQMKWNFIPKEQYGVRPGLFETPECQDALDAYADSSAAYNTITPTEAHNNSYNDAILMAGGSLALGMPDAEDMLSHFLGNTGTIYTVSLKDLLLENDHAGSSLDEHINNAIAAAEYYLTAQTGTVVFTTTAEETGCKTKENGESAFNNWYLAIGEYRVWYSCTVTKSGNNFTMNMTYHLRDFYDWDPNNHTAIGSISQAEMYTLHCAGMAKHYKVVGSAEVTITWQAGETVGTGADVAIA